MRESTTSNSSLRQRSVSTPTIFVLILGVGGLTVYAEIAKRRPDARFVYAADDAVFPYGEVDDERLTRRVTWLIGWLIGCYQPDLVVIACNTASTIVLPRPSGPLWPAVRGNGPGHQARVCGVRDPARFGAGHPGDGDPGIYQGTDRAICDGLRGHAGRVSATGATGPSLAGGRTGGGRMLRAEISPCFIGDAPRRTDTVVLACTHYPLLRERIEALAPWPVHFIDPAAAIARRVVELVGSPRLFLGPTHRQAVFTGGGATSPQLRATLARFGFADIDGLAHDPLP